MSHFKEKYLQLTGLIDEEFKRNIDLHGGKIKCCKGCSKCCWQIFRITKFDAEIIREYLDREENHALKEKLQRKAEEYLKKDAPHKPCPALGGEGECMIYPARPVICRRFGPPVYNYKEPGKIHACELNFTANEEIIDANLIEKQTEIGKLWDEIKTGYNETLQPGQNISTTIAETIFSIGIKNDRND